MSDSHHAALEIPRRAIIGWFLRLFVPLAAVSVGVAIAFFRFEIDAHLAKIRAAETTSVRVGVNSIEAIFDLITRDVAILASQKSLMDNLTRGDENSHAGIIADWLAFSRNKGIYDQIRLLDQSGRERVRVNYNDGDPGAVPDSQLQDKGKRYYFTDSIKLNRGEFFVSPFDLNIEDGKIEQPIKPTVRVATPAFDREGRKKGIVLLNYNGARMLEGFGRVLGAERARAWLLNGDGYWLKGPSAADEWGFMYQRPEASLARRYGDVWQRVLADDQGQFENEQGLWTFATVYPLIEGQKTSSGTHEAFAPSRSEMESRDYFWKAVLFLPSEIYREKVWQTGIGLFGATGLLLLVLLVGCWRLASAWVHHEAAEAEVRRINEGLERTVAERTEELKAKNDELDALIYVVSRDLQAPLSKMREFGGWLDGSLRNIKDRLQRSASPVDDMESIVAEIKAGVPSALNTVLENSKKIYPLINGLHKIASAERSNFERTRVDVHAILTKISAEMDDRLREAGGRIKFGELPDCVGDATHLSVVFEGLLDNAVKFRDPSRPLTVTVGGKVSGDRVIYEVADNGIGIAPEHTAHVWELLYRRALMGDPDGAGLGLSLIKRIIDRLDGRVSLKSEKNVGTRIIIDLPRAPDHTVG